MRAWERTRGASQAAFLAATVISAFASEAAAQECQVDADCGAGYECEVYSSTRCAGVACAPGQTCPQPVCETIDYGRCVNAACEADADCPAPMLCHAETQRECSGVEDRPTCAPGVPCEPAPPPAEPTCTERTVTSCRQPYELPCTVDADCGGGFRCVEEVSHWCNGSVGVTRPRIPSDVVDGGAALPAPPDTEEIPTKPEECGTTPTGRFSCQLQVVPCDADADCPSGLACLDNPSGVSCSGGTPVSGVRDAGVATPAGDLPTDPGVAPGASADPIEAAPLPVTPIAPPVCETIPAVPAKQCRPPHWGSASSGGGQTGGRGDAVDEDGTSDPIAPPAPNGGVTKPTTRDERNAARRETLRKLLRNMFRNREGCSLAVREDASALDLSWLLIAGALAAGAATRRRR